MSLTKPITSHHTVWVTFEGKTRSVRYDTLPGELVCWADRDLVDVPAGSRVGCGIHEIASGPLILSFWATVRALKCEELTVALVASVHGNALDYDSEAIDPYEELRCNGRFVGLVPDGEET
jgi:hypothetical protein